MINFDLGPLRDYFRTGGEFDRGVSKGLRKGFPESLNWLTEESRNQHPSFKNRTRNLARSLKASVTASGISGDISSDVGYSRFLYEGTKAHFIRPRNARSLSWVQGGTRFFSNGHMVSGIKESPWIEDNYERRENKFNRFITDAVEKEFN